MPLARYIEENLDHLVAEWSDFARTQLPPAKGIDEQALREGAAAVLRSIISDMRATRTTAQQKARSRGQRPEHAPGITKIARAHAAERLRSGFTLGQLVAEYRALRASVFMGWTSNVRTEDRVLFDELVRFDEAMDHSLTEAVSWFNEGVERARDIFVGILGHDLRAPLNAAWSAAELVRASEDNPVRRQRATESVLNSLRRISSMIDGLLDFARTRLGTSLPITPEVTNIGDICTETIGTFELSDPEREFRCDFRGDLIGLWDAERIKQLLANLTRNALDYGAKGAPVTVSARAEGEEVLLSVHNDGPAIPQEQHKTIFDPLVRGAIGETSVNKRSSESMGLGLYIVRQIAEAHGGSVEVASDDTSGTTFTVRLPRRAA